MKIDRFKASSKAPGLIRCCVLAALVFAFTSKVSVAQKGNDHRHLQYRTLWTKSVLATLSACKIKIAANDIAPGEEDCSFTGHLPIGSKVFVVRRSNSSPWARLRLRDEDKAEFEVYLKNDSPKSFRSSFELFFSTTKVERGFAGCEVATKLDVIRSIGFPTSLERKGGNEVWKYEYGHAGGLICEFDVTIIRIKNDKVISVGGTI